MDAYTLAMALAPTGCHLSLSLMAAIGQVESGNLEGQRIDADHRVAPRVLGPVLDGSPYAEIPDTDSGKWDGNRTWDRAIGPMQLLPASWRTAGMDADGDGLRDPQNVYDAAGAAMVYLCDGGRDLGTRDGLEEAVLAYNHSRDYLRLVLAWKTVFDTADITGFASTPTFGAWAAPTLFAPEKTKATGGSTPPRPSSTSSPESEAESKSASETTATASGRPPTVTTGTVAADPTARPTTVPTASEPADPSAKPKPDKPADKPDNPKPSDKPGDKPSDEPLPTCATDEPTPTDDPDAEPTCCPAEPAEPTATATPSTDPSADPSEEPDPCATETPTPSAAPTP